jgi:hypothetical protein
MASYSNGVFGGLNRLLASALVAGVVLVLPPAALACNSGVSAVNVYKECVPSGSGGKSTSGGSASHSTVPTQTSSGSTGSTSVPVPVSKKTVKALKKAGSDGKALKHLVIRFGAARLLQSSSAPVSEPTAVGSAFDLGSGPTALLIVLAGTAVLLLAATGFRGVRQRRH